MSLIFPQPQKIESLNATMTLAEAGASRCCIVLAGDADAMERAAAALVSEAIAAACGEEPCTCSGGCRDVAIYVGRSAERREGAT